MEKHNNKNGEEKDMSQEANREDFIGEKSPTKPEIPLWSLLGN